MHLPDFVAYFLGLKNEINLKMEKESKKRFFFVWVLDDYKRQWSHFIERFIFVFFESRLLDRSNPIAYTKYIYIFSYIIRSVIDS